MNVIAFGLDRTLLQLLEYNNLKVEKHDPDETGLEDWLIEGAQEFSCALVNIDSMGLLCARPIRENGITTPIIGLTSLIDQESDSWSERRASFLENGGDDLLTSKASSREVLASIRAVHRRLKGGTTDFSIYHLNGHTLRINKTVQQVTINGNKLTLTVKEFALMDVLSAGRRGQALSKEVILTSMYSLGSDADIPEIKIVDVFIHKLRRKLDELVPGTGEFIETSWGRGYRLMDDAIIMSDQKVNNAPVQIAGI